MVSVDYRMMNGYMVRLGMLARFGPRRIIALQPENNTDSVKTVTLELPNGEIRSDVPVAGLELMYLDTPDQYTEKDGPERFQHLFSRTIQGVEFTIGAYVYFPDEPVFRQLTGHTEPRCIGYLTMIDEEGKLFIGFIANPNSKTPQRYLLQVKPAEIEVIVERIPLGQRGLRIRTLGVDGSHERDVHAE